MSAMATLRVALRWWLAELAALRPGATRPRRAMLGLGGAAPVLLRRRRGGWQQAALLPAEGALPRRALRPLRGGAVAWLAVPAGWVLRRTLRLPEAALPRLDAVLAFEIEAQLPMQAEEVVWATRLLRRLPEAGRVEVEVAVLPRRLVAPMAARLRAAGIGLPLRAAPEPGAWPVLSLDAVAPPRAAWRGRLAAALAAVALLLGLHLMRDELRAQGAMVAALEARSAAARDAALRAEALEAEVAALRSRISAAAALRARPPAIAVLEEVARRLPDGAWLTEFRLAGDRLILTGQATAPDALIGQLGAAPAFREVRFAAPVTRGGREGGERVQLSLRVAALEPAAVPARTAAR
jgi:general secretion pathway protein L